MERIMVFKPLFRIEREREEGVKTGIPDGKMIFLKLVSLIHMHRTRKMMSYCWLG